MFCDFAHTVCDWKCSEGSRERTSPLVACHVTRPLRKETLKKIESIRAAGPLTFVQAGRMHVGRNQCEDHGRSCRLKASRIISPAFDVGMLVVGGVVYNFSLFL